MFVFLPQKLTVLLNSDRMTELTLMNKCGAEEKYLILYFTEKYPCKLRPIDIENELKFVQKSLLSRLSNDNKWPQGSFLLSSTGS